MDNEIVKEAEKLGMLAGIVLGIFCSIIIVTFCGLLQLPYIVPALSVFLCFVVSLINFMNEATKQGKLD